MEKAVQCSKNQQHASVCTASVAVSRVHTPKQYKHVNTSVTYWHVILAQFRYIKIQPNTIDLISTKLVGSKLHKLSSYSPRALY